VKAGARPCEVVGLTVESVDWPNCCQLLHRHKTYRHTGKARPLTFAPSAMMVLEKQRAKYGAGLLFRTRVGNAWTPNGIVKRLLVISERAGFRVVAYGLGRHSFATAALVNGVPDAMVAGLLGHTGTGMLSRHYSHVTANARAMRDAAERARGRAAG
jgi:integrase